MLGRIRCRRFEQAQRFPQRAVALALESSLLAQPIESCLVAINS